ncbi:MAG TPA: hypothetical protein VNT23_03080, partial [Gaiellaceae bacterium]|nr:hypothetical protein [Gaiellaceae bacterium]
MLALALGAPWFAAVALVFLDGRRRVVGLLAAAALAVNLGAQRDADSGRPASRHQLVRPVARDVDGHGDQRAEIHRERRRGQEPHDAASAVEEDERDRGEPGRAERERQHQAS